MTDRVHDWLPPEVGLRPIVRRRVAAILEAWSADWFTEKRLAPASFTTVTANDSSVSGDDWRRYGRSTLLQISPRAMDRLLGWALDVRLEDQSLSEADHDVLSAFGSRMIGDLASRIEKDLGGQTEPASSADPRGPLGGVVVAVGDGRDDNLLALALPLSSFLPLCRSELPVPRAPSERPSSLVAALGPTRVDLSILVSSTEIELAELRGLAPGDVVVLDRGPSDPMDLTLADAHQPVLRGLLGDNQGRLALTISN